MRRSRLCLLACVVVVLSTTSGAVAPAWAADADRMEPVAPRLVSKGGLGMFQAETASATSAPAYAGNVGAPLGFVYAEAMVADDADSVVFVTAQTASGPMRLFVLTQNGHVLSEPGLSDESGARALEMVGSTLYVARCEAGLIDAIDTTTMTRSESIPIVISPSGPCKLAVAGGRLWYQSDTPVLASVTLSQPHTYATYPGLGTLRYPTSGADPNLLAVAASGRLDGLNTLLLDASSATPTVLGGTMTASDSTSSLSPDGQSMLRPNGGSIQQFWTLDPAEQTTVYSAHGGGDADAPIFSPDGAFVAFGADSTFMSNTAPNELVYATGGTTPTRSWRLPEAVDDDFGLVAFSANQSTLYAINYGDTGAHFHALAGPTKKQAAITVAPRHLQIRYGAADSITIHLGAWSTNRRVHLWQQPYGKARPTLIASPLVNSSGNAVINVSPKRNTAYWATYEGDAVYGGSTASRTRWVGVHVIVTGHLSGYYAVSSGVHLFHAAVHPAYSAQLRPVHRGSCLTFVLEVHTTRGWAYVQHCFAMNRYGVATVHVSGLQLGHLYRIAAAFDDTDHMRGTAKWSYFKVTR
jgi:hypothetical protein